MKKSLILALAMAAMVAAVGAAHAFTPDLVAGAVAFLTDPHAAGVMLAFGPLVRNLQAKQADVVKQMTALNQASVDADRDFTAEESAQYDKLKAEHASLNKRIERAMETELAEAGLSKDTTGAAAGQLAAVTSDATGRAALIPGMVLGTAENVDKDPKRGFVHMGDFSRAVIGATIAVRQGGSADRRLLPVAPGGIGAAAPATFGNEGSGADGGFLVPPEFARTITALSLEEQALLPMADNMPIEGNAMSLPKDETTPWGSNGIRAFWQGEGAAGTPNKPLLGRTELRLKKLLALVPMSDELMADQTALNAYIPPNMARSIRWKTDEAVLFGNGAGVPLGAFAGSAHITVAAEGGQTAGTVVLQNVAKMVARLLPGSYSRGVWIVNNDVLPQLFGMTLGNYPIYLPLGTGVGGVQVSPYGTLMGRPVMVSQHAKSIGTSGDIMLVDLSWYQAVTKSEGVTLATSLHLYFDADAVAFRSTFRVDGTPKLSAPVSPQNGSNTLSPFVQLAAR